jgi:hypothetical protein
MSLRVKIREQAKTYEDYAKEFIELCHSKAGWDVRANYKQQKLVSVDVVSGLLDKATEQIEQIFKDTEERVGDLRVLSVIRGDLKPAILVLLGVEGETKK